MSLFSHMLYALAWVSFGLLHSVLAGQGAKARLKPFFGRSYRLAYNLFALLHIGAVWLLGQLMFAEQAVAFAPPDWLLLSQWSVFFAGLFILLWGGRLYDMALLGGWAQFRGRSPQTTHPGGDPDEEPLHTDHLHRYVRHPLYAGGFLVFWGLVRDELSLATALYGSAYLIIGASWEEKRLIQRYGTAYQDYRQVVPAFIPWKGRAWHR